MNRASGFRLSLEYDGTDFAGWQVQPGRRTVQGEFSAIAREVTGSAVRVEGAGRTDAGVHAMGQVVRLDARWTHGPERLRDALNARLPFDLAVRSAVACRKAFDPRRHAISRVYRYAVLTGETRRPLYRRCAWWVKGRLDVRRMAAAARVFAGRHDFSSFTTAAGRAGGAVRRITSVRLRRHDSLILIDVCAPSFIHHQVRVMAGEIVAAGQGRSSPAEIRRALTRPGFRPFRWLAPPQGLCLLAVRYAGDGRTRLPGWPPGVA